MKNNEVAVPNNLISQNKFGKVKKIGVKTNSLPFNLMLLPAVVFTLIFCYLPMFGLVMAFQDFKPFKSFWGSKFVGFENFKYVFTMPDFSTAMINTVIIASVKIVLGVLVPLSLALLFNELEIVKFKKIAQTTIFIPNFISWAILGGIIIEIFSYDGMINSVISVLGIDPKLFMVSNTWFRPIIIFTDTWKNMGYGAVVYLAAITNVDPALYESAMIDGAGKWKQLLHITIPGILPIVTLLSILGLGNILNAGFDQILILYNPIVYKTGDVIDTLVYRMGIFNSQYSPAAAAGLFKSVISIFFVSVSYYLAHKFTDYRIF